MVDQQEEAIVMMKGKRTKRPRPLSSLSLAISSEEESGPRGAQNYSDESMELVESTVDSTNDEDMAHCLILLAQGSKSSRSTQLSVPTKPPNNNNSNNNKGNNNGNSYECKTCNKSFASFQALGGHRASHKKPKLGIGFEDYQTKKSSIYSLISDHNHAHQQLYDHGYNKSDIALSLHTANGSSTSSNNNNNNNNNNKAKVHECSICGAEFSSGQALGGHMRRHRPIGGTTSISTIPSSSQTVHVMASSPSIPSRDNQEIKTHNFLSLDLNLPAPEDEPHQHQHQQQEQDNSKFVFPLNGKTLAFSATSLVDCHY